MTLDGTRTWLVGERDVAIIDPGPLLVDHVAAVVRAVAGARVVALLLTHEHPDHADAAAELASRVAAPIHSIARGDLDDGALIPTDAGEIVALRTPGHSPDHAAFHWPAARAVFCGDLMMGGLATALVAPPGGDLADYLRSLARIRALGPALIHPAHGPSFDDPLSAIDACFAHREQRIAQVIDALAAGTPTPTTVIAEAVYGDTIPDALRHAAHGATLAYLRYLEREGRVFERAGEWWRSD